MEYLIKQGALCWESGEWGEEEHDKEVILVKYGITLATGKNDIAPSSQNLPVFGKQTKWR